MEALIVTCLNCVVAWNMDFDPPQCHNANHELALNVLTIEVQRREEDR